MESVNSPHRLYRAGVIGCGGRGRAHMPGLLADSRVEVVALADASEESAQKFQSDFSLDARTYPGYETLLAGEKLDVVVIALWTGLHLLVVEACIAAGVPVVLCEKPMAATWSECQAMAKLAEDSGTVLTFCHQRRFASGNLKVRELVQSGRFGAVERVDLFSPAHLLDCGTHSVDQALAFLGEPAATWVLAGMDLEHPISYFQVPAEESMCGVIQFANGVHGTIRVGGPDLDFWGGVRVTGSDGFVEVLWDGEVRRAVVYSDPTWTFPVFDSQPEEQMIGVVKNAIDAWEQGIEPDLSYRKAYRANEILFALYESARRRERVTLPLEGVTGNPLFAMLEERCVSV
jgi:UDP-N-acetyl-2-amino-2-deoxyglucuronate dehydrogenase